MLIMRSSPFRVVQVQNGGLLGNKCFSTAFVWGSLCQEDASALELRLEKLLLQQTTC